MPLYSMCGPPAVSDSPSAMSNGVRFSSASIAMKKITKASGCQTISGTRPCPAMISEMFSELATIATAISESTSGSS